MKDKIEEALQKRHGYAEESHHDGSPHGVQANLKVSKLDRESGTITKTEEVKNIIPNAGAQFVRDAIGSSPASNAMSAVQVGTGGNAGAFTSSDSQLHTHEASSVASYGTTANNGEFQRTTTFTNLSVTVDESGLFAGTAVADTPLAMQTFGDISLTTNDSLEVQWKVFFSDK